MIKVPCAGCIVKVRCKDKIKVINNQYYIKELLGECYNLREFFGLNTPTNRVKLKNYIMGLSDFILLAEDKSDAIEKFEAFLKTMHKPQIAFSPIKVKVKVGPKRRK